MTNTVEMNPELRAELIRLGWEAQLDRLIWGRRVSGDPYGVTIERDGRVEHYSGPLTAVRGGDQIAIVRFG